MLVMELCACGDLLDYVRRRQQLTEIYAKYFFYQLIKGIFHIHEHNIIHRDIKLENLLIDNLGKLKIADFGVSVLLPKPKTQGGSDAS